MTPRKKQLRELDCFINTVRSLENNRAHEVPGIWVWSCLKVEDWYARSGETSSSLSMIPSCLGNGMHE